MSAEIPRLQGRGMTTSDQLARWARRTPDAVALRFEGTGRSYAELDERVTRLARALADDATYAALAEALDCALVTGDRGLATAPGPRCERRHVRWVRGSGPRSVVGATPPPRPSPSPRGGGPANSRRGRRPRRR